MKVIRNILRKFDTFGVPFAFRYKGDNKYQTPAGGLIVIIFTTIVLCFSIYYFIPFIHRKNFAIVYYTMSLPYSEQINFKETKAGFAVGLDCYTGSDGTRAEDVFQLQIIFTTQSKDKEGKRNRNITTLKTHPCTYEDFHNNFNYVS